ncbi:GRAM domain-containing protein 2A [Triplophysa tibetana]|uniref:GRAM domain-containing protein 2A n=1 Tax=Triplophysa tibetana TaxID=1572043 RepID=A0A5A9PSD2_9TELE|nr:GRAM domain-containing protein 2A [Triplophysa tibetana]
MRDSQVHPSTSLNIDCRSRGTDRGRSQAHRPHLPLRLCTAEQQVATGLQNFPLHERSVPVFVCVLEERFTLGYRIMTTLIEQADDMGLVTPMELTDPQKEDDTQCPAHFRQSLMLQLIDDLTYEDVKKCYRGSTVSKYNSQYHKLFSAIPNEEILMKVYSCALLRDILLQGRLYISRNWLCFYANLFGKDIKVAIPVVSVSLVKKHKTAGLVPNGLAITTDTSQKVNGKKSLSLKEFLEEPGSLSTDEFPVTTDFTPVLKWRRKSSAPSVSSSLPDLLGNSTSSLSAGDATYTAETPLEERRLEAEKILLSEPVQELGQMEYHLLKFFILLIILLIISSCYLAFRVCSLEQQLSFLNTQPSMSMRDSLTRLIPRGVKLRSEANNVWNVPSNPFGVTVREI